MNKYKLGVEIGCGDRYSSELYGRWNEFEQIQLIEPNEILYHNISSAPNPEENISVGNFAIAENKRKLYLPGDKRPFFNFGYCSFLQEAESFLKNSCEDESFNFWQPLKSLVNCKTMSEIDSGQIDYLVLTCQGSEMSVLEDMVSRPKVIRTKYYCHNAKHWEYYNQISTLLAKYGYTPNLLDRSQYSTYFHIEWTK